MTHSQHFVKQRQHVYLQIPGLHNDSVLTNGCIPGNKRDLFLPHNKKDPITSFSHDEWVQQPLGSRCLMWCQACEILRLQQHTLQQ